MLARSNAFQRDRSARFEGEIRPLLSGLRASSMRLTRNRSEAEDLLQETVLRAWRFWDRFEAGSNLRAWVHRILRNTFANRYRRRRREVEVLAVHARLAAAQHDEQLRHHDAEPVRAALSAELASGLNALPPPMHAVLWAVAVDELSYREAAERIGCPIGTVMSRLHRAKDALKPRLSYAAARVCA